MGMGVLTQGSPQQPRDPRVRACSPMSGRPGSGPPPAAGELCSPQDGARSVPQTLDTMKGSMSVRPTPWGGWRHLIQNSIN